MDGKIKTNWGELPAHYINSLRDIRAHEGIFKSLYQQEFPVSTFLTRIKEAMNPYSEERENRGNGLLGNLKRHGKDGTYVRVRFRDLEDLLRIYEDMDNRLREIHIDADLRSEPTIINIPNSIEKEQFIKDNPQALF